MTSLCQHKYCLKGRAVWDLQQVNTRQIQMKVDRNTWESRDTRGIGLDSQEKEGGPGGR